MCRGMSKTKAILFDFDGTIMDTNQVIIDSWNYTCEKNMGRRLPLESVISPCGVPLEPAIREYVETDDWQQALDDYRNYQHEHVCIVRMFEGTEELLNELKDRGYLLSIVTSRSWDKAPLALSGFEAAAKLFDLIISFENSKAHKHDPEPILKALEELGVGADEAVYVGDSKLDLMCADNAGVKSVLVGWSLCFPPDRAEKEFPADFVIDKPSDLLDII